MKTVWARRVAVILAIAGIAVLQRVTPLEHAHWHFVFPRLYYVPVVLAALYGGWRGGTAAALLSSAALLPHLVAARSIFAEAMINHYIEAFSFWGVGLLTGVLADRERRREKAYREMAERMSAVYGELQANFEGMKRAERLSAIGQLSAGLAHEIRNPLASIAGAAAILQRGLSLEPKHARCLEIIAAECQRLNGLLENFLNFARPPSPRFRAMRVETVLESVAALAGHAVRGRRIRLETRAGPGLPEIECDPEQLQQVLLNLAINAIEASPDPATVTLAAVLDDGAVAIRIIDRGCGVPPADIDKLFNPFFTTKEQGTGLGLSVAHQIVRQLGGSITAERNPGGAGMTFSVLLPVGQPQKL